MHIPTVFLLLAGGFTVHSQQFEPFNENSISLDGLFDEEFDSINPVQAPSPPPSVDTTTSPELLATITSPIQSINSESAQPQSGLVFDEVEFPPEATGEEVKEERGEVVKQEMQRELLPEEGKTGISIYRPLEQKVVEKKKKKSGSTGWSHKRKRLVRKGTKIVRANWTVLPSNVSTRRPHFAKKRRIVTRVSHVKPVRPPRLQTMASTRERAVFRPAPFPRVPASQWTGTSKKKGISRQRSGEIEGRQGPRVQSTSRRMLLTRVARTDERAERELSALLGGKTMREQQRRSIKNAENGLNNQVHDINELAEQIQVKSARQRFEYALYRNPPRSAAPLSTPLHKLSSSSFSHYSPPPLQLPPVRTTQLSSHARHRLNAHSAPVLLHRLHDGEWRQLLLLQKIGEGRRRLRL